MTLCEIYRILCRGQLDAVYKNVTAVHGEKKLTAHSKAVGAGRTLHMKICRLLARSRLTEKTKITKPDEGVIAKLIYRKYKDLSLFAKKLLPAAVSTCDVCPYMDGLGNCFYTKECKYKKTPKNRL